MSELRAPSLALDEQLCFALYAASRAMTARYRPMLEAIGLTYPQYLVMLVLWDDGPSTVSQIGSRLRLDSGTLSPLLKRLEQHGLITRRRRADDERSVEIRLTDDGAALRGKAEAVPQEMCQVLGDLNDAPTRERLYQLEERLRTS
jgi:DNA-binding MarR family transcriptional regulator